MCGIAAIFAYDSSAVPVDGDELGRIAQRMRARGPDDAGQWMSAGRRVGLAHRRLSIIDPGEGGRQPMSVADGDCRIVFNGEIYNYKELRAGLQARGFRFRSHGDTEVLLALYLERGAAMVDQLRGMFAFAIWDQRRQGLLLARDHFGIKPLYLHDDGRTLRVASQVKALVAGGGFRQQLEPAGQVGFYLWGNIPEPWSLYKGLVALPAGHTLWVDGRGPRSPLKYFELVDELSQAQAAPVPSSAADEALREALRGSVAAHLVADVSVGCFLSAGVDSAVITEVASGLDSNLQALTLAAREYRGSSRDELPLATVVARHCGVEHHVEAVDARAFVAEKAALLEAMDQPSVDGVNTYLIAAGAARRGWKVAVSGIGADELLGGYASFQQIPQLVSRLRRWSGVPGLGVGFRRVSRRLLEVCSSPKYAGLLEYGGDYAGAYLLRRGLFMPWELPDLLDPELVREGWQRLQPLLSLEQRLPGIDRPGARVCALELDVYLRNQLLRDADWAGMAHSLEIRMPLVDIAVFRALAGHIVGDRPPAKSDMWQVPQRPLPPALLARRKTGFTLPVQQWTHAARAPRRYRRGLREWAVQVCPA